MSRRNLIIVAAIVIAALLVGTVVARSLLESGASVSSSATQAHAEENSILILINRQRVLHHLTPFKRDAKLDALAREHNLDMEQKDYFAHDAPDGVTFASRFHSIKPRRPIGEENIAWGTGPYGSASSLVSLWMHSPGHRANILNPAVHRIGIGILKGPFQGQSLATIATNDFSN